MAPIILEGETLGEKHRYYNKLINQMKAESKTQIIQKINYDEPDLYNLVNIDIAANQKDLQYIVETLKCEDMLYVSRVLKQSVWLITDKEYAHIINPSYLYTQLLPQMTSKAGHKLLLSIRFNLKDEKRVEEFYNYYEHVNELETALKWLPNCSLMFIENVVEKHAKKIPCNIILKLCKRSCTILEICARIKDGYDRRDFLTKSAFLLNNYAEKYLAIVVVQDKYDVPHFSSKYTEIIMKKHPDIILNNFEKFAQNIDKPTFVKCLKQEDIADFLLKQLENQNLKKWFNFEVVKYFIARMPSEGRFDFIKRIYIDKVRDKNKERPNTLRRDEEALESLVAFCSAPQSVSQSSNEHIYKWYRFAPFATAFADLKKLIHLESNPKERNAMLAVLMICARQNLQNIQAVLQYYREKHINEPFKFKSHFINIVLNNSSSHKFDNKTWGLLDDIFCSMEVYSESENNVQSYLKHIVVYKVLNDVKVPDIVEKKFKFDTLQSFQRKLNESEKDKIFNYLYQSMITKIENIEVTTKTDFKELKKHLINVLNLLAHWKKDILDHGMLLEKIRELVQIKVDKSWNENLSDIYNVKKSWRKHMFRESLLLQPTLETCINALKHGPQILDVYNENIAQNNFMSHKQFLSKLRLYWPQTLAKTFENTFLVQLNNKITHKIATQGLCILLPQKQLNEIITKYKPVDTKINWAEKDELTLSIQKHFAKYMHLARPQPRAELVLLYAKNDYLQYVLPSLHSILFNISVDRSLEHIPTFLDAPVSLQKHGLKFAFAKMKTNELLTTFINTWKTNKNASIRATIIKLVFNLLCKEQNETNIKEIWIVLNMFIDTLTHNEDKVIYVTLGKAYKVPISVKQEYCIKTYKFLKSLPSNVNCDIIIESLISSTLDIMESMDAEFVAEVVNDSFDEKFTENYYKFTKVISACLLSTKSETIQTQRYERVFVPLLVKYLFLLKNKKNNLFYLKYNFDNVLQQLHRDVKDLVLKKKMITPIKLFNDICSSLEKNLSIDDYYVLILTWKLAAEYMKIIDKYRSEAIVVGSGWEAQKNNIWDDVYLKAAPDFGKVCMEQLKMEMKTYFPSIYILFSKALGEIFERFNFSNKVICLIMKYIQIHANVPEGHLLVLQIISTYIADDEETFEVLETLRVYPSVEVRMHYQQMLRVNEGFNK